MESDFIFWFHQFFVIDIYYLNIYYQNLMIYNNITSKKKIVKFFSQNSKK